MAGNDFWPNFADDSVYTLRVKNFVKIAVARSVSEITRFCVLHRISRWPPKVAGNNFCENLPVNSADTLWVKNFVEITLARSVSEINMFLRFTQNFKMATKSGGKMIFAKTCQYTLQIPCS